MNTKKMILLSILVAQAMVLFILEMMIPTPFLPPGAKLGLANLIVVIALYMFSFKECFLIIMLRTILSALIITNLQTMIYSMTGAMLSLIFMFFTKKLLTTKVSPVGVSCVGAFFHNVGQLLTASVMFKTLGFFYLLPINSIIGVITGSFIGFVSMFLLKHMKFLKLNKKI